MNNCGTCAFWTKHNGYSEGECSEIHNKVTADVEYGWDGGYVQAYDTEEDFYCSLHMRNERVGG